MVVSVRKHNADPIIVLGVERSGTSVVAEMIHRWGAYAGDQEKLHKADMHAPRGYWEYLPVWDLLEELGEFESGATWWARDFQKRMAEKASDPTYRSKAMSLISEMSRAGRSWFWKDPALSHFLPFWQKIWGDVAYVVTIRNPHDVAVSWEGFIMPPELQNRVSFVAMNLLRWQHMMLQILRHTESAQRKLFICYEDVIREPAAEADRLRNFLNTTLGVEGVPAEEMAAAVDGSLWRNRSEIPFEQFGDASEAQKALFAFAKRKVRDVSLPLEETMFPFPSGYLDFLNIQEELLRSYSKPDEEPFT